MSCNCAGARPAQMLLVMGSLAALVLTSSALLNSYETSKKQWWRFFSRNGISQGIDDDDMEEEEVDEVINSSSSTNGRRLLIATRIHNMSATSLADPAKVVRFIKAALQLSDGVLICLGQAGNGSNMIEPYILELTKRLQSEEEAVDLKRVKFLPVSPWGYFVTALNAAVQYAQDQQFDRIAFQSLEFSVSEQTVGILMDRLNRKQHTIMAGPEMDGHEFIEGKQQLRGRTCPWNTFAIWKVSALGIMGFAMIGDGVAGDRSIGGVEELSTITLLQRINPKFRAELVRIQQSPSTIAAADIDVSAMTSSVCSSSSSGSSSWNTKFDDPERRAWHERKMKSKDERPAQQMALMGIPSGLVHHVIIMLSS